MYYSEWHVCYDQKTNETIFIAEVGTRVGYTFDVQHPVDLRHLPNVEARRELKDMLRELHCRNLLHLGFELLRLRIITPREFDARGLA